MSLPLYKDTSFSEKRSNSSLSTIKAVIGVAAGKGGVGKSTVVVNLALALTEKNYRVGILDADIYGPSIRKMLPEECLPMQKGEIIEPALCRGIKMISMAYFCNKKEASAVRAPIANSLIAHFINQVAWGDLDVLLVDFPPGTGDIQLTLCQQAQLLGAIIVTTPQEIALMDVRKAISLFDQVNIPLVGIIENMSYYQADPCEEIFYPFGKGGGERLAEEVKCPFLGKIPLEPLLCQCGDTGSSLFESANKKQQALANLILELTSNVIEQIDILKHIRQKGVGSFQLVWQSMEHTRE